MGLLHIANRPLSTTRACRNGAKGAVAVAVLAAFAVSPVAAMARGPVESMLEMRQAGVVIQKWDLSCGAAALSTLLIERFGVYIPERDIAQEMISRPEYLANPEIVRQREGFSLLDLKRFVERRGYEGVGLGQVTLDDLEKSAPAIVPLDLFGYNHFVIFRGVVGNRVVLADPAYGNRTMSIQRFESAWIDSPEFGRVAFLVIRPGEPEETAVPLDPRSIPPISPTPQELRQTLLTMGIP